MSLLSETSRDSTVSSPAMKREKQFDWFGAAVDYRKAVSRYLASNDFLKAGRMQERIAVCLVRAAFQAETAEEFEMRINAAAEAYVRGAKFFAKLDDHQVEARIRGCEARCMYIKSLIERKAAAKRRLLESCCSLAKNALEVYTSIGNQQGAAEACNDLVVYFDERLRMAPTENADRKLLKEADDFCERSIAMSLALGEEYETARAYHNAGRHYSASTFLHPLDEQTEQTRQRALGYLERAIEVFERIDEPYLLALAQLDFADFAYSWITLDPDLGLQNFQRLLEQATKMRDNYLVAQASFGLAFLSWWMLRLEPNPDKKREWYRKSVEYARKSMQYSKRILDDGGIAFACWLHSYAEHAFAEELATQPSVRRRHLEQSIKVSRTGVEYAESSGILRSVHFTKHALFLASLFFSEMEPDENRKREVLDEALKRGEECMKAAKVSMPYDLWNIGLNHCFLTLALLNRADTESDPERAASLRKKASLHWKRGRRLVLRYVALYPDPKRCWALGTLSLRYGEALNRLYHLLGSKSLLHQLVEVCIEAASMLDQIGLSSLAAQAQWQIARSLDLEGRFSEAGGYFDRASRSFRAAAEQTPLLKYWYRDNALYMLAWKEIEEAKRFSVTLNNLGSAEHYRRASTYLKETLKWRYLAPYYLALSLVELEAHLRNQNELEEAKRTLDEAAAAFEQAQLLFEARKDLAESSEEREEISKLSKIVHVKKRSCQGRLTLDEEKVMAGLPEHPERAAGLNAFEDACIRARITAPKDFAVGRETRIGLDLVNIGRKPGSVIRIEHLIPPDLSVLEKLPGCSLEGGSLNMKGRLLGPLQTVSFQVKVRPTGHDAIELRPRVVYVSYQGDFLVYDVEPVLMRPVMTFASNAEQETFSYLVSAFQEDHMKKGLSVEKSGWRTRPEILKGAKAINKRHVYGAQGRLGPIVLRLRNHGLIDVETVTGRRGRGGLLTKIRIACEKEIVRRYAGKRIGLAYNSTH